MVLYKYTYDPQRTPCGAPERGAGVVAVDDRLLEPIRLVLPDGLEEVLHSCFCRVVVCLVVYLGAGVVCWFCGRFEGWCVKQYIKKKNQKKTHTHNHLLTNGPHQQIGVLQRRDEGQVALPRGEHVQEELVERDGQRLERGRVPVHQLCA